MWCKCFCALLLATGCTAAAPLMTGNDTGLAFENPIVLLELAPQRDAVLQPALNLLSLDENPEMAASAPSGVEPTQMLFFAGVMLVLLRWCQPAFRSRRVYF